MLSRTSLPQLGFHQGVEVGDWSSLKDLPRCLGKGLKSDFSSVSPGGQNCEKIEFIVGALVSLPEPSSSFQDLSPPPGLQCPLIRIHFIKGKHSP